MSFNRVYSKRLIQKVEAYTALPLIFTLLLFTYGCSERVDVNAPPKDIWVVYGVLDPQIETQDLRIGKAFQVEENAFTYAETHDPAVKGLSVRLSGGGESWEAIEVDSIQKGEGDFSSQTSLYRFETGRSLQEGEKYTLSVGWPDDSSFQLLAETRIPPEPQLLSPQILGVFEDQCLMGIRFEDSVQVIFKRKRNNDVFGDAFRYQIGIQLNYTENNVDKTYRFGPTRIFEKNVGCGNVGDGVVCYQLPEGGVVRGIQARWDDPLATYDIDDATLCGVPADLSRFLEVKVTAIDSALGRYMFANDPTAFNLNTYRIEYSNIRGSAAAVGIFGSINHHNIPVNMSSCTRQLIGLEPLVNPRICN
ncbi:MAG: DUF4249 family protein [Bacteroidia bacterium]